VLAVGALIVLDLAIGGGAHLTKSVLHAEGSGDLADIVKRRFEGSGSSLSKPGWAIASVLALAAVVWLATRRRRLLDGVPKAFAAGLIGAWFATVIGAISNDSGPLILVIGAILLLLGTGYVKSVPRAVVGPRG
jgi:hypothetical protein